MTLKRFGLTTVALAALLLSGQSFASSPTPLFSSNEYTVGKGDLETELAINPQIFRGDFKDEFYDFRLGANYFFTDIFAPGMEFDVKKYGNTFVRFMPTLKAYWPLNKRWLPYAMVGVGYLRAAGANLFDFALGPGINFMVSDTVALGLQFRYDLGAGDGTYHEIQFPIGFHVYFKI